MQILGQAMIMFLLPEYAMTEGSRKGSSEVLGLELYLSTTEP